MGLEHVGFDRRLIPANVPVQRQAMKRHKGSQKAFYHSFSPDMHMKSCEIFDWNFLPTRCVVMRPSIPMAQAHRPILYLSCGFRALEIRMKIGGRNDIAFIEAWN